MNGQHGTTKWAEETSIATTSSNDQRHDPDWNAQIEPYGPIGLLIEASVWNGVVIDDKVRSWQKDEEPLDVLSTRYQHLKKHANMMVQKVKLVCRIDQ